MSMADAERLLRMGYWAVGLIVWPVLGYALIVYIRRGE